MNSGHAPLRFVVLVVGMWVSGRLLVAARWPAPPAGAVSDSLTGARPAPSYIGAAPAAPVASPRATPARSGQPGDVAPRRHGRSSPVVSPVNFAEANSVLWRGDPGRGEGHAPPEEVAPSPGPGPGAAPSLGLGDPRPHSAGRWTAEAYLFARGGRGRPSLAAGGQLGASQTAVRVAYALDENVALAARGYAPLGERGGGEAALGVDWRPLPRQPVRVSVERRVALAEGGREAWSLYVAGGGGRRGLPEGLEVEGYAQAGVVGMARRALFVDGAARLARPVALGENTVVRVGAAAWGAAQPGAARFDLGPRAALSVPLGPVTVTAAIEYRARVAGHARPGSGAAFTLSTGF